MSSKRVCPSCYRRYTPLSLYAGSTGRCKVGTVQLIYKKGDTRNWRPICLQTCVFKLYPDLLARRLIKWMEANGRLTDAQKGFRAVIACAEHNFVSTAVPDQTRRRSHLLHLVWYYVKNAAGTVPHGLGAK